MTIELTMIDASTSRIQHCPGCNQAVDPLRSPAVSVIDGKIVHFCSVSCRERYLKRSFEPPPDEAPEAPPIDDAAETAGRPEPAADEQAQPDEPEPETTEEPPLSQSELYRAKLLLPQIIQGALWIAAAIVIAVTSRFLEKQAPTIIAASALAATILWTIIRDRKLGPRKIMEALAVPASALAVLSGGLLGLPPKTAALAAACVLAAEALGKLLEFLGRYRSGVLRALNVETSPHIPTSWRDNSDMAARIRTFALVLEWVRYPLAALIALPVFFAEGTVSGQTLVAFAASLVALNPRTIRMATGDAHLEGALRAAALRVKVRDADAIHRAARARTVLFTAKQTLFKPQLSVLDWQTADHADPKAALDALMTLEANAAGRIAEAARIFASERKARAASNVEVARVPGRGLVGETPWGTVLCGARSLLLDRGISTGLLEPHASAVESSGRRAVFMAMNDTAVAVFAVEEQFAEGAETAIRLLRQTGIETAMITSAEAAAAQAVGNRLGIDAVFFETPEEKLNEVLRRISDSAGSTVLVGRGAAFEEHFRTADAAVSFEENVEDSATQAGFDAHGLRIDVVPKLIRISRQARRSATVNLILAVSSALFGAGLAAACAEPSTYPAVSIMSFLVSALCTFNAPFPAWEKLKSKPTAAWRGLKKRFTSPH